MKPTTPSFRSSQSLRRAALAALGLSLFSSVPAAQAGAFGVSNLNTENRFDYYVSYSEDAGDTTQSDTAQSFTPGSYAELNSITLSLGNDGSSTPGGSGGGFHVSLWSDVSGHPGSPLMALDGETAPDVANFYTFTAATPVLLIPNTPYWAVISVDAGLPRSYDVPFTDDLTEGGASGWTIADSFSNRLTSNGAPGDWGPNDGVAIPMGIHATAVPEPGSAALLLGGFAALGARRRRK